MVIGRISLIKIFKRRDILAIPGKKGQNGKKPHHDHKNDNKNGHKNGNNRGNNHGNKSQNCSACGKLHDKVDKLEARVKSLEGARKHAQMDADVTVTDIAKCQAKLARQYTNLVGLYEDMGVVKGIPEKPEAPDFKAMSKKGELMAIMRGFQMYYSLCRLKLKLKLSNVDANEIPESLRDLDPKDVPDLDSEAVKKYVSDGRALSREMNKKVTEYVHNKITAWSKARATIHQATEKLEKAKEPIDEEKMKKSQERMDRPPSGPGGGRSRSRSSSRARKAPGGAMKDMVDIDDDEIDFNSI
jgi:hypothetical protein